jgi:hypothetical protein
MSVMDDCDRKLFELARAQHQVFTTADAASVGISRRRVLQRVEWGLYEQLYDRVYTFGSTPASFHRDLAAAEAAGGPAAFATGPTGAELRGLPGQRQHPLEITCPRWMRARHDGLHVRERIRIHLSDLRVVQGLRVSRPELTIIELARSCGETIADRAFHTARRKRLVTYDSMLETFNRHARRGVPGIAATRRILERYTADDLPTESEMETLVHEALRRANLPDPDTQVVVRDAAGRFVARADFGFRRWRVVLEYHSRTYHTTVEDVEADERKRNQIWMAGWIPIVARYDDLKERRGADFLGALRSAIDLRNAADASNLRRIVAPGETK